MSPSSPTLSVRATAPTRVEADVLVVGVHPDGDGVALQSGADQVDAAFAGGLARTLGTLGATGKAESVTLLPSGGAVAAPVVAAVGLGSDSPTTEALRRAAGAVVRALAGKAESVAFALTGGDATAVSALAEGALLGAYTFDTYRSGNGNRTPVARVELLSPRAEEADVEAGLARARTVAGAVVRARDWVNTPPADLYPERFAEAVRSDAEAAGLEIEILGPEQLAAGGYGGILGVGQGSERPPHLVRLSYRHPEAKRHLALAGKGITFDTGGISLKPNEGMTTMKCDMAGAATVLATGLAVAELGAKLNLTVWAPLAENMPSGSAILPSDVLRIYGGKTVEVMNTDAEGRLVLADALARASEDGPDVIVDVATLTGACVVALGTRVYGIFANDDELARELHQTAERVGEAAWPLPIPEESRERLDSKVADLMNVASQRAGGALVAGAFLREFVGEGIRWAHLDIAGPSFNEGAPWGYTPSGGTGVGVRTLVALAEATANGQL